MKLGKATLLGALDNIIWPILVIVYVGFAFFEPKMLRVNMIRTIVYSSIPLGFLVLAEAIVLLNGHFDLSVGQIAGLSAAVGTVICKKGLDPVLLTLFMPIGMGAICGSLNGFLVGRIGLNAFLVTLGTFLAFDGIQLLVLPIDAYYCWPEIYLIPGGSWPVSISIFVVVTFIFHFVLHRTKFGYHYLAVGSTPRSAAMMGLSLPLFTFFAYVFSGALSGAAGILFTGYTNMYGPLLAEGSVFMAFAGAILGGISIKGGRGKIMNVFGGVVLLGVIQNGLVVLGISPYVRRVLFGSLVIVAIIIDLLRIRVRESVMKGA